MRRCKQDRDHRKDKVNLSEILKHVAEFIRKEIREELVAEVRAQMQSDRSPPATELIADQTSLANRASNETRPASMPRPHAPASTAGANGNGPPQSDEKPPIPRANATGRTTSKGKANTIPTHQRTKQTARSKRSKQVITTSDGKGVYIGEAAANANTNAKGQFTYNNGFVYIGEWRGQKIHGMGKAV